jgi:hypothetical protein
MSILGRERTLQQVDKGIELLRASVEAKAH